MTERDFNRIPTNEQCPFIHKIVIKEHKKLVEVASIARNKDSTYELLEKNSNNELSLFNNIKIEQLVLADKKSYEGKFIKFFKTKFLCSLNLYSLKIFVYIAESLEVNNNKVILDIVKIGIACEINEPRKIYDGLSELIEKKIIAKHSTKDIYYVNPSIIFRGSNRRILLTHQNY